MTLITPPKTGEDVNILAPHARLRGQVTDRSDAGLTVELEETPIRRPFRFTAGSEVELEWTHSLGVMQHTARVDHAEEEPRPTLVLQLVGLAEPIERRAYDRIPVELVVSAWSLAQPTMRLHGNTVDLSVGGALLWLPDLSPAAASIQLRIALPHHSLGATGAIRWRREPGLVGVQFEKIAPDEQERLVSFLREPR